MPFRGYRGFAYIIEVKQWCTEQFGDPTPRHVFNFKQGGAWFTASGCIYFQREQDAILYALRWL